MFRLGRVVLDRYLKYEYQTFSLSRVRSYADSVLDLVTYIVALANRIEDLQTRAVIEKRDENYFSFGHFITIELPIVSTRISRCVGKFVRMSSSYLVVVPRVFSTLVRNFVFL